MSRPDRLSKQLVDSSLELMRRKPWDVLPPDAFFLIAVPTEEHPLAAVVTGRDGIELGLTLSRGEDGLARALRTIFTDGPGGHSPPEVRERWDHIGLGIETLGGIPPAFRGFLDRAGFRGRREILAPLIYSKRSEEDVRPPTRQEMRTILWCLGGVFAAMDGDLLEPSPIARGQSLVLIDVTGSLGRPDVQVRSVAWEKALGSVDRLTDIQIPGDVGPLTHDELDGLPIENPSTLEEWKLAERHFIACMASNLASSGVVDSTRAMRRYFGDDEIGEAVLDDLDRLSSYSAYIEWLAADYRPTRRSKTWLEKFSRARSTPPVQRVIAQARCEAEHSIYRIDETDPGTSMVVEDVYSGRRLTVYDKLLSTAPLAGLFLPLRLMVLGEWTFPVLAGPPFKALQIDEAMRRLDDLGLPPTATDLRPYAELLGRLWAWYLYRSSRVHELQNTDGDPLLWHTASYKVAEPGALVGALEGRDDVVCDEPGSGWTWLRGGDSPVRLGETICLCQLKLLGDELIVEANSARRMALASEWVDSLPGVTFLAESTKEIAGMGDARPLDDRLPRPAEEPMPAELIAEVRRLLDERHRAWLDLSIPMLGGQTPRQACADPAGRQLVERLIRTMPATGSSGGKIEPPRQELLDELGIG